MDHPPLAAAPNPTLDWGLLVALGLGLALVALGLGLGLRGLSAVGLLAAVAGTAGVVVRGRVLLRQARGRERLLQDLTRNLDDQVGLRTQRLMRTIEDLESFNRMVTHDLSSPLNGLLLGLERLSERLADDPDDTRHTLLHGVSDSAHRMQELIRDLRQLALISGRITTIQLVDLSQHATLVLRTLREREPGRVVVWDIEPGITVPGDASLLRIALENLLGNAWKFTAKKHPAVIRVRRGPGPGAAIEISDNGCGFEEADTERLFEPFFRANTGQAYPGSGLGLSIVRRVMSKHGGQVSAASQPGRGATFRLSFPFEDSAQRQPA